MATSGTVSATPFPIRKLVDHSLRRAGMWPQKCGSEIMSIAQALLYTVTSEWANVGFPLWTRQFFLRGIEIGSPEVTTPTGTVEILHAYWRILQPYRGAAMTTGLADASLLFGGQPNADVTIAGPGAGVFVNFTTITELDTVGVLLGGAVADTAVLEVQTSSDAGVTWTTVQTLPSATYTPGEWTYFDLDPFVSAQYVRLFNPTATPWVLNQLQFGLANGQDILIGPLNIDDYFNLPNKQFPGDQCISGYQDRQLNTPVLKLWPVPSTIAFYNGCISVLARRYIQDPGTLTNDLEVPQRWLEAIIWRLGSRLIDELPDSIYEGAGGPPPGESKDGRIQRCETMAARSETLAWGEERTRGPIRLMPNMRPYNV
jgi:hypothetical protein